MCHLTCRKDHLFQFFFFLRKYAEIYSVVFIVGCFVTFFCSIKPSLIVRLNLSCQVIASPVNNSVHVKGSMTNRARQAQRLEPYLMGCRLLHERSDRWAARSWKGLCTAAVIAAVAPGRETLQCPACLRVQTLRRRWGPSIDTWQDSLDIVGLVGSL
jgi:hypothetical protein